MFQIQVVLDLDQKPRKNQKAKPKNENQKDVLLRGVLRNELKDVLRNVLREDALQLREEDPQGENPPREKQGEDLLEKLEEDHLEEKQGEDLLEEVLGKKEHVEEGKNLLKFHLKNL